MKSKYIALCLILGLAAVYSASDDLCRYFPNNTKIRDPDSCGRYITCVDSVGEYTTCPASTPFFDKDGEKCVKTLTDHSSCAISCADSAGKFLSDPKSCKGYYYCLDETSAQYGKCPDTTHFNATEQSCIYKHESNCHMNQFDLCMIVKDGVNIKDENNCHRYFYCKNGELLMKECKSNYYNPVTGACVQKSQVNCLAHPLPSNVCGTEKAPKKNKFVADGATCRGYFFCADKGELPDDDPIWGQCPPESFFNAKTASCENPLSLKCTEDRCDGRTLTFVSANTKGCRNYLRCKNGKTEGSELSCGNKFFDEKMSACVSSVVQYDSCS